MLVESEIKRIIDEINQYSFTHLSFAGLDLFVRFIDSHSKLSISSTVYNGGNYIPSSVRKGMTHRIDRAPSIKTFLSIDEDHYQINLNYLGNAEHLSYDDLKILLEEFTATAEQWRDYLDENDRNDLVYIHVK